jgi:hypothetical protein
MPQACIKLMHACGRRAAAGLRDLILLSDTQGYRKSRAGHSKTPYQHMYVSMAFGTRALLSGATTEHLSDAFVD